MELFVDIFKKEIVKRTLFLTTIAVILYFLKPLLNMFLLTFLFTYLINSAQTIIVRHLKKITPVKEKVITVLLYAALFLFITLMLVTYVPVLVKEVTEMINQRGEWGHGLKSQIYKDYISMLLEQVDIQNYIKSGFNITLQLASKIGTVSLQVFIALILSMFFMLEKKKVKTFLKKFEYSKISGFYKYFCFFGNNFVNTFGKVIQAQIVIAFVNSLVSVLMLSMLNFPNLATLWFMIFCLSLIPVAGVIISLVPLCIIAFKIGGISTVAYVLIMIAAIHAMESYFLNPKLMSAKIETPIFITFVILLVSEHFLGVWGLLVGIPLFMFLFDLLDAGKRNLE
ncbi:MAG: AI-2E family transporter [Solirubrobacterales bacterium]